MLLPLKSDDFEQVSTCASRALASLQVRIADSDVTSERRLSDVIVERIDVVVTQLPRVMHDVGKKCFNSVFSSKISPVPQVNDNTKYFV